MLINANTHVFQALDTHLSYVLNASVCHVPFILASGFCSFVLVWFDFLKYKEFTNLGSFRFCAIIRKPYLFSVQKLIQIFF